MQNEQTWLAADYHFPFTYSCRSPVSSPYNGRALPTPGPVTIKLALIHTAVELFGIHSTQTELFSPLMAATVLVKPPTSVVISTQFLHGYKANDAGRLDQSLLYREFACAQECMTVFLAIPLSLSDVFTQLLRTVGYWGQASSFTSCVEVKQQVPEAGSYAEPLAQLPHLYSIKNYFSAFVSEFHTDQINWPNLVEILRPQSQNIISPKLYVWPLIISEQRSGHVRLLYRSLDQT